MFNGSYCQATLRSVVLSRFTHGISRYSCDVLHRKRLSVPKIYWIYIVPEDICKLKHWRKHLCVIPPGRTCDFAFWSLDCYYQSPFLLYDPESAQANWLNNNCLRPGQRTGWPSKQALSTALLCEMSSLSLRFPVYKTTTKSRLPLRYPVPALKACNSTTIFFFSNLLLCQVFHFLMMNSMEQNKLLLPRRYN